MKNQLLYVELKTGYNDNGPAWIGKGIFNRTWQTVYFNGQAFQKGNIGSGNYFETKTGDAYWISGIKKDGTDRHWAGRGKIQIDKSAVEEYLEMIGEKELPKSKFMIVELDNNPPIQSHHEKSNQKLL